jgi:hypothetical protein
MRVVARSSAGKELLPRRYETKSRRSNRMSTLLIGTVSASRRA